LTFDQISQEIALISSNLLKNYVMLLLKTMFSPRLDPVRLLRGLVQANGVENLAFGQISQLRLDTRLINNTCI